MKKANFITKKTKHFLFLLFLTSVTFYSCEQKTDLNVQSEENRLFFNEIGNCFETFAHSKLKGENNSSLKIATTRYDTKCEELADDLKDVYITFPDSTEKKYYDEVKLLKTIEDLFKLQHATAAEFSLRDSSLYSCKIQISEKTATESLKPFISPSRKFLYERGFTDREINEMVKENNATESDLVLLALVVNELEVKNQQVAKSSTIKSFNLMNLFATPAYAYDNQYEKCTTILKDVYDCGTKALGIDFWNIARAAKKWTKEAIKQAFKAIAKDALGAVGAVIATAEFIWCLHGKGYF